jgi:CRP-like cAMP-binding protein
MQSLIPTGVLANLTAEEMQHLISLGTTLHYNAGDVVFREHSIGREWYVILEGRVRIDVDPVNLGVLTPGSTEPHPLLTLGPGGGFGELALFDAGPRSATVVVLDDHTHLLVITPQDFDRLLTTGRAIAAVILNNLVSDLSAKLRQTRLHLLQQLAANHHVRALYEELYADCAMVDPLRPLPKTLVIRDPNAYVLANLVENHEVLPTREILDVLIFAAPGDLLRVLTNNDPPGEVILHGLFSLLRHGRLPAHIANTHISYRFLPDRGRRTGYLIVNRADQGASLRINWEVKGWHIDKATATVRASLCLTIPSDPNIQQESQMDELIAGAAMPIQQAVTEQLRRSGVNGAGYRLLTVHHRTHEVARTLQSLRELGFQLDAFVGIPYGEASWGTCLMLDHASDHRYFSLQAISQANGATTYRFDALHSSFLPDEQEQSISGLYTNPAHIGSYRAAMNALLTHLLDQALRTCRERGERLLIYEDGAYITPLIYAIYHHEDHPLHTMIRAAVDTRLLVGSVEVTTSGERAQVAVIKEYNRAILPVISGARDDVKLIFEAVGVAEAVINAASTALGNLGLPTFAFRRVAILGGNGAIGVRVVEQLAQLQHSVGQLVVVDPVQEPFARPLPVDDTPVLEDRLRFQPLPRYNVNEGCVVLTIAHGQLFNLQQAAAQILAALTKHQGQVEFALYSHGAIPTEALPQLWERVAEQGAYELMAATAPTGVVAAVTLHRDNREQRIMVLGAETVLVFPSLVGPIRAGFDTVLGVTGTTAFQDADLEAFLARPAPNGGTDDLVLISGSSKDYEFQKVLAQLNAHINPDESALPTDSPRKLSDFRVRKSIIPDVGSVYHLACGRIQKRLIMLADGFVVNFFAKYEKGVKTEYMDPIMTMQLLGLMQLAGNGINLPPGLHQAKDVLPKEFLRAFWHSLDARCARPEFVA